MKLSVCIAVKNRSRVAAGENELLLLPNCVRSLVEALPADLPCELVVTDWDSDDWPLADWLPAAAEPIPVRLVRAEGPFSRGRGLNMAADAATGDALFFTDADSLFSQTVIEAGMDHLRAGRSFFPVLYSFNSPEHDSGWWRHSGYGTSLVLRSTFAQAGRWPEYTTWGGEDDEFFACISACSEVVREEVAGFYHQWHPEDILWKDRYGDRDPESIAEIQQVRRAIGELARIVPAGESLVLVDEARFGIDEIEGRRAWPFLEAGGEYAGPPADDAAALIELERLREQGAGFVAFAWMAFWWLEHYAALNEHLRTRFRPVLDNERLRVFDMRGTR